MGGIIQGFLGGAAQGTYEAGKMLLSDKLSREREEAESLRQRELQQDKQSFTTSERKAGETFESGENKKDRTYKKEVATAKAEKDNSTTNMKDAAALIKQGYPEDVANSIAHGGFIKHTDIEGNQIVVMPTKSGFEEVGKITTDMKGNTQWVPSNGNAEPEKVVPSTGSWEKARKEYNEKASMWTRDEKQFGMTEKEWVKKRAEEIETGGLVNSVAKESPQPKKLGAAPPDGTIVKGKDGKMYVVKDGKPVLKTQ